MPARLPPDLLERSAPESARLLALSYLDQTDRAQRRLGDSDDREALHDFRVGLRRLRSALSAYREPLEDSVTGKMRRRIRDLARATGGGRDAEVQLAWLAQQAEQLRAEAAPGFFWLVGRLEARKVEVHDPAAVQVARRYAKASGKFRRALGILRIELENGRSQRPARFGEVSGRLIRQRVMQLQEELGRIRGAADFEQVHRARIALKRLRYLIEPIARRNRRAGTLIRRFKEAQDLLGEHHDLHVLAAEVETLRAGLSASRVAGLEPGLVTLARLAEQGATSAYERFHPIWSGELGKRILTRADELGKALQEPSIPAPSHPSELAPAPETAGGELIAPDMEHPVVTEMG